MITYKYRAYPNKEQQVKLWKHANRLNTLYNYFLADRIKYYDDHNLTITKQIQSSELPDLKVKDPSLKEIHSQVLQYVPLRLDLAYQAFFKRFSKGQGFPKFRSCRNFFGIRYVQSGYKLVNNVFHTKIYGDIRFNKHRPIKGTVKQVHITTDGKDWYICVITDHTVRSEPPKDSIVGIDVGITNLAATSDDEVAKNPSHAKYFDNQVKNLQSRRSKCKRGSRRYKFYSKTIKRLYCAKTRKINDFQHRVSKILSQKYDTIVVEDLKLKKMSETDKTGLNRELRNSKISHFIELLTYKANRILKVNPMNTSKTCNSCGRIHKMPLNIRTMHCVCGNIDDRDVNAAKNILCLGQAIISGICTVQATIQTALKLRSV